MTSRTITLSRLYVWNNRAYFSGTEAWKERGLNRSPDPVPYLLTSCKDSLVKALLEGAVAGLGETEMCAIIVEHWSRAMKPAHFDTEEREFLGDCFFQIAASLELSSFEAEFARWCVEKGGYS